MTRWLARAAAGATLLVQAASNALYAYRLGHVSIPGYLVTVDGVLLAVAAVCVAVLEAVLAKRLLAGETTRRGWCALALAVSLAFSGGSLVSHVLQLTRAQAESEIDRAARYDRAKKHFDQLESDARALGTPRPVAVLAVEVRQLRIDPATWRDTHECRRVSNRYQQEACAPALAIYKEQQEAAELARLTPLIDRARAALDGMTRPEDRGAADEFLAAYLPWAMMLVILMFATFGFGLAALPPPPPRPDMTLRKLEQRQIDRRPIYAGPPPAPATRKPTSRRGAKALVDWYKQLDQAAPPSGVSLDGDGWCMAGQEALAVALQTTKPTVSRWLASLAAAGEIELRTSPRGTIFKVV